MGGDDWVFFFGCCDGGVVLRERGFWGRGGCYVVVDVDGVYVGWCGKGIVVYVVGLVCVFNLLFLVLGERNCFLMWGGWIYNLLGFV